MAQPDRDEIKFIYLKRKLKLIKLMNDDEKIHRQNKVMVEEIMSFFQGER